MVSHHPKTREEPFPFTMGQYPIKAQEITLHFSGASPHHRSDTRAFPRYPIAQPPNEQYGRRWGAEPCTFLPASRERITGTKAALEWAAVFLSLTEAVRS